jgi:hypothetical protein
MAFLRLQEASHRLKLLLMSIINGILTVTAVDKATGRSQSPLKLLTLLIFLKKKLKGLKKKQKNMLLKIFAKEN